MAGPGRWCQLFGRQGILRVVIDDFFKRSQVRSFVTLSSSFGTSKIFLCMVTAGSEDPPAVIQGLKE